MSELPLPDDVVMAFERGELILPQLDHEAHVYLAWCYLTALPLLDAVARLPRGIRRFATEHGDPEKFNATLTMAYLLLIYERIQGQPQTAWSRFRSTNPDLFTWPDGPLHHLYSPATLGSAEARRELVPPDRSLL